MRTETLEFSSVKGETTAYVALPDETDTDTKAVIVVQEYWGLNDNIKKSPDATPTKVLSPSRPIYIWEKLPMTNRKPRN